MRALCHGGWTLVELLVVVAVAAVLAGVVLPRFGVLLADAHRAARTNDLVRALQQARHASIQRAIPVAVCPSADGVRCDRDWNGGRMTFIVRPGWHPGRPVEADDRLAWTPPGRGRLVVAANRNRFTMRPFRKRSTNGTIVVCDPSGRAGGRAIVVAPTGRVRTTAVLPDWVAEHCP